MAQLRMKGFEQGEPAGGFVPPRIRTSARWAAEVCIRNDWVVLDTETTGMGPLAQVINLAIVNCDGVLLCDLLMRPSVEIELEAFAVHGISKEKLAECPTFADFRNAIEKTIDGRRVMIYNDLFDRQMLLQTANAFNVPPLDFRSEDVMTQYAEYFGEWNEQHQDYVLQKLPGAKHTARGDADATWRLIQTMGNMRKLVDGMIPLEAAPI